MNPYGSSELVTVTVVLVARAVTSGLAVVVIVTGFGELVAVNLASSREVRFFGGAVAEKT